VVPTPSVNISFHKVIIQAGSYPGDIVSFDLVYQNDGTATLTNYHITDYRPATLTFLSASPMPQTQITVPGGQLLDWYFTTPLVPGGTGKVVVT